MINFKGIKGGTRYYTFGSEKEKESFERFMLQMGILIKDWNQE